MPNVGATTLITMVNAAADRADMPTPTTTTFVPKSTWVQYVNAACQELHEKLAEAYGSDYRVATESTITTDGTNSTFALPTDFFKLLGVDLLLSNVTVNNQTNRISLRRFNFADRNKYTLPNIQTLWGRTNMVYRLRGDNLWLTPLPAANQTIYVIYVPRFTPLVNDADSFDGINGWEEWVVNDAAMKALAKEESDISQVAALQAKQEERLTHVIENRDAGMPATTVDVYRSNGWAGDGWPGDDWGL